RSAGSEPFPWALSRLFGSRHDDLLAVVVAAVRAHPMRLLQAAAVAAGMETRGSELPVRAPLAPARARVPSLGYCHRVPPTGVVPGLEPVRRALGLAVRRVLGPSRFSPAAVAWSLIEVRATRRAQAPALLATA